MFASSTKEKQSTGGFARFINNGVSFFTSAPKTDILNAKARFEENQRKVEKSLREMRDAGVGTTPIKIKVAGHPLR